MSTTDTKVPYIYESPDGGKTVTRRKFGEQEKETIQTADEVVTELFGVEPAVSTLTDEHIEDRFKSLRETLKSAHTRSNWTQDYTMSKHVTKAENLLTQLEREIRVASEVAKLAIKGTSKDNL